MPFLILYYIHQILTLNILIYIYIHSLTFCVYYKMDYNILCVYFLQI